MEYVVLDIETTGLDCRSDAVLEIGAVKIAHGILCEEFSTLINPGCQIPEEISELTGITNHMVVSKPELSQVIPELERFFQGAVIVGHNVSFDRGFLSPHLAGNYIWLDTLELAKILLPYETGYSLGDLTSSLNIDHMNAHRALGDAQATACLFLQLLKQLSQLDYPLLETLYMLSQKHRDAVSTLISQEFSARVRFFSQEKISSRQLFKAGEKNKGLFSFYLGKEKNENYVIPPEEISGLYRSEERLNNKIAGYKYRSQQEDMAQAVSNSFNQGQHLIVEAGTGTGKSLAYLLPAVLWSVKSGKKVVISTHTINLQEQLITKDIPLAKEILELDLNAAVVKGRNHYLCLRKWEYFLEQENIDIQRFMMRLVIWLRNTETGDCSELNMSRREMAEWQRLAARRDTCFGVKCQFYRGDCFFSRAKKMAELAHMVIVNHSLLLANAAADDNILPDYKYLVIDEAHHLEKVAEEQFGAEISFHDLMSLLNRLKKTGNNSSPGLLDSLAAKISQGNFLQEDTKRALLSNIKEALTIVDECVKYAGEFFTVFAVVFFRDSIESYTGPREIRIMPQHRERENWTGIVSTGENLIVKIQETIKFLLMIGEKISLAETEFGLEIPECYEINLLASTLYQVVRDLEVVIKGDEENYVSWIELNGENNFPILHTSPVEVREQLQQHLFSSKSSVVLTSATLTVGGNLNYFSDSIGIELAQVPVRRMQLESPFAFDRNALLAIASDLPDPGSTPEFLFVEAVAQALIKLIRASQGRTMVLFTSHYQLKQVYEKIKLPLKQAGITVYAHGITGSRTKLLEYFKSGESSVILGANSFWEGVDVVGEALTSVIIVKLPFWPPVLPTVSARLDRYKSLHLDGFRRYSLPQAIIRFKQGFGRLIRSHTDFGVICVLDRRIYEKKYGETFIKSLPKVKIIINNTDELSRTIKEWLDTKGLS